MRSIKTQVLLVSLFIALLPFLSTNWLSYYLFSQDIENNAKENTLMNAKNISERVQGFIDKSYSINEMLSKNSDVVSFQPEKQTSAIKQAGEQFPYIDLIYIQGTDGMQTARTKGKLSNRSERWWFKKFMQEKEPFVSKSYYSISTGSSVTSIFHGIVRDSQLVGILGTDFKLSSIQEDIERDFKNSTQQAIVLDSEGVVIAHPDKKQVAELYNYVSLKKTILKKDANGNPLKDEKGNEITEEQGITLPAQLKLAAEKGLQGEQGITEFTDENGDTLFSAYYPIKLPGQSSHWVVITTENKSVALSNLNSIILKNAFIAAGIILLVVVFIYFFANKITRPIIEMDKRIKQVASGDLNITMKGIKTTNRELSTLAAHMNEMINTTAVLVRSIQNKSHQVKKASEELYLNSEVIEGSAAEITRSIQEVASSADAQARSFEETARAMEEMSLGIQRITESSAVMSTTSQDVTTDAVQGNESIQRAISQMNSINESVEESAAAVQQLVEKSHEIESIIEVITDISNQTNLLALNAAIEAARAGEHGRSFSVVADEVRKLAEQSNESAEKISRLIQDILGYTNRTVDAMNRGRKEVENGLTVVTDAGETFMRILQAVSEVSGQTQEVSAATEQMMASSEEITATVDNLLVIAQEASNYTQTVSDASVDQGEKMEYMRKSISSLDFMAKELQEEISKFKV